MEEKLTELDELFPLLFVRLYFGHFVDPWESIDFGYLTELGLLEQIAQRRLSFVWRS